MPSVFGSGAERENSIFLNSVQFVEVNQIINEIKSQHCARATEKVHIEGDEKNTQHTGSKQEK